MAFHSLVFLCLGLKKVRLSLALYAFLCNFAIVIFIFATMMDKKVLIIGNHPVIADITKQYRQRGDDIVFLNSYTDINEEKVTQCGEIFLLSDYYEIPIDADNKTMSVLKFIANAYAPKASYGKRLLCHLLVRSYALLHTIRLNGFRREIEENLDVNVFTMEDQWCQFVALNLDREPITKLSEKTVHLVIFGMSEVAEQVAINTAHVCHFPNYLQKSHSLRTRITVIDEAAIEKSQEWTQRYKHLFDNCFYRFVDTNKRPTIVAVSRPMYKDREDFVDIEWEFVSASAYNELIRDKISQWSVDPSQQLTVVFAKDDLDEGMNNALHLPESIASANVPVYVYMHSNEAFGLINHSGNTPNIIPFGMADYGYDINIPIVKMAKNVNYIYDRCYEENEKDWNGHLRFAVAIDEEKREELWTKKSGLKRMSNIYNAMTIGVKMRSMGFKDDEWDKLYDMSNEEVETLAEIEHNRWSVEELILGWRPCTDSEQREVEADVKMKEILKKRKIHYDLRAYNDLRPDGTGRPVQVYDRCLSACIPLIAKESKGGGL